MFFLRSLLLTVVLLGALRAEAFSLQGGQQPQPGGDGTAITITYSYNNFLDGGLKNLAGISLTPEFLRTVSEEAFDLWASVAPIHFVEVADVGTPVYTSNTSAYLAYDASDFGVIRLNHRYINGTDAQNGKPSAKAMAWFPNNFPHMGSDIHFDNGDPWEVIGTPSAPDILGILTHEIGHTLGIGHSGFNGAVMFPAALRRMGPGTGLLTADDIAAAQAIYGDTSGVGGAGSVTPLPTVPEPSALLIVTLGMLGIAYGNRWDRIV